MSALFGFIPAGTETTIDGAAVAVFKKRLRGAVEPYATGAVYVNHPGADEPARVRAAYGKNYARLVT